MKYNKKVFYLISLIIGIAIILQIIQLFDVENLVTTRIVNLTLTIGLIFGFIYARENYTKGAADYYRIFMLLYALSSFYVVIASIVSCFYTNPDGDLSALDFIISLIMIIPAFCEASLALIKDLGRKTSMNLAIINFAVIGITTIFDIIFYKDFEYVYAIYIGSVLLALLALLFVYGKYNDKLLRGSI